MGSRQRRILIVDGHPDPHAERLVHALATAYANGAAAAGHAVRSVALSTLALPLLHTRSDWEGDGVPEAIAALQHDLLWADHIVILFPLWLGDMPALLKGLLEQLLRPGFAFDRKGARMIPRLGKRSARIIITMGMPAFVYRLWFGAHAARLLSRGILGLVGIGPVRVSIIGSVEKRGVAGRALRRIAALGKRGA